jgi:hypothetical protein
MPLHEATLAYAAAKAAPCGPAKPVAGQGRP